MKKAIVVRNLKKLFNTVEIFQSLNLEISSQKITAIIGPNGSGKSTLLNILSGIFLADGGSYFIKDFNYFNFSYIFQNYRESLLPWRTNFENISFPLEIQGKDSGEIRLRVNTLQEIFKLNINWDGYPYELSGGQQQILAFMRALITQPSVILIDEPFSALDYENNLYLREHLQKYYMMFRPTIVLVTHNVEEAVHVAHEIIILSKKPTQVVDIISNDLSYPRTLESLETAYFQDIRKKIIHAFRQVINL